MALLCAAYLLPFWFWLGLGFNAWVLLPLLTAPLAYVDRHARVHPRPISPIWCQ